MMRVPRGRFHLFNGGFLDDYLEDNEKGVVAVIEHETENYILNVNETEYIDHLYSESIVELLEIHPDSITVNKFEIDVPAKSMPRDYDVRRGGTYTCPAFKYFLPYSGNANLLLFNPSPSLTWTAEVYIEENCICFEVFDIRRDSEQINRDKQKIINYLSRNLKNINEQVQRYNEELRARIEGVFKIRKEKFLRDNKLLASLGVPIRRKNNIPETYAIPTPSTVKKIGVRPIVTDEGYTPEPSLDDTTYKEILQIIFDWGRVFERHPATYRDKSEEDLRDHILLILDPRFVGSATGETFNRKGKTDILLRHENTNVFVAECMFWAGQKKYLEKITQLLGYLTWRDSKAAMVLFVKNKDITSVLGAVENETPNHENYLGFVNRPEESWFNYRFHIIGDNNREVRLAVLLIHIPPT